jgi:hypothetical protein
MGLDTRRIRAFAASRESQSQKESTEVMREKGIINLNID